jgi:hypothetical protein
MRGVLVLLAGVCLALGLQPWLLVPWLGRHRAPALRRLELHAAPSAPTIQLRADLTAPVHTRPRYRCCRSCSWAHYRWC